jgi:putative membrane protein
MTAQAMMGMTQSGMMGDGMMSGMMGGGMLIGWLVSLLVLAGLTALVVWAVRELIGRRDSEDPEEDDALAAARRRYARGEIDREEFRTLRSDLETA